MSKLARCLAVGTGREQTTPDGGRGRHRTNHWLRGAVARNSEATEHARRSAGTALAIGAVVLIVPAILMAVPIPLDTN
ncbi:MAG TPA: hypothetical protein VHV78_16680 [Gemmatimonadaceae bacterium]|nr:hypothetical protein [Gemmatimonadaceae bacterium]